jgi:DNA-binding NtrC family response regulator
MSSIRLLLVETGDGPVPDTDDFGSRAIVVRSALPLLPSALLRAAPHVVVVTHLSNCAATIDAVRRVRQLCEGVPLLLLARESSEAFAIDAFHAGVTRYLRHPWQAGELAAVLDRLVPIGPAPAAPGAAVRTACGLVGVSAPMCELRRYIAQIAPTDSNVLITGETGTGKELVAQSIHEQSTRHGRPFVCLNSAAIPDALVESELFGYERGAFTGAHGSQEGKLASANRGTAFFDEIGDVSPLIQAKLLRAIETKQIHRLGSTRRHDLDVRILAATNQDLEAATQQNRFRSDLYYRLNVIRVALAPLRERIEDVPGLVDHCIQHFNRTFRQRVTRFTQPAVDLLMGYAWPGNVRELRNVVESVFVALPPGVDGAVDLPRGVADHLVRATRSPVSERTALLRALAATNWNKTEAARSLHWSRMTLYRKMTRYDVRSTE